MKQLLGLTLLLGVAPGPWCLPELAAQPPLLPPPVSQEAPEPKPPAPEETPSEGSEEELTRELLGLEQSLVELAADLEAAQSTTVLPEELERDAYGKLLETGQAPVLARPTGRIYPFGESVPRLLCAPDRACDLELETGEVVDGVALGATDRWEVTQFFEGEGEALTPHILLKPSDFDLATNLVVVTNRRTYHLELASIGEDDQDVSFDHHVSFWYPQSWALRVRAEREARKVEPAPEPIVSTAGIDPGSWHFGYRIEMPRKRKQQLPWRPRAVFDDGERIYIRLPPHARPLPAVVGRDADGSPFPLNEQLRGEATFVIPALVPVLELVTGTGKTRRWVRIRRLGEGP